MSRPTVISPPLPLPMYFTLLPSLLPTRSLIPFLYSEVNDLPIYVSLTPSHDPHMSILPLSLALQIPPLEAVKTLPLGSISVDLGGSAPFADIWVPLSLARSLCETLGVLHLFRSETKGGLLCDIVDQMISWEEGGGICHNWVPSPTHLSPSAYSLETLLSTPFGDIDIIPDERCTTTTIGRDRKAKLVGDGELDDPSRIRSGEWALAWDDYINWTLMAWADFAAHPSQRHRSRDSDTSHSMAIHRLLIRSTKLSFRSCHLAHPISGADIAALLKSTTTTDMSFWDLLLQILYQVLKLLPFITVTETSPIDRKIRERKARIQLGVVEFVGLHLLVSFARRGERGSVLDHGQSTQRDLRSASAIDFGSLAGPPSGNTTEHRTREVGTAKRAENLTSLSTQSRLYSPAERDKVNRGGELRLDSFGDGWLCVFIAGSLISAIVIGLLFP